jgi:hypothetical protein
MATVKKIKKAQKGVKATPDSSAYYQQKFEDASAIAKLRSKYGLSTSDKSEEQKQALKDKWRQAYKGKPGYDANGFPIKKNKTGGKVTKAKAGKEMIKRADGSYSQRGLWDNIRANKGSGKKPTAQMLKQEKKIKSKSK